MKRILFLILLATLFLLPKTGRGQDSTLTVNDGNYQEWVSASDQIYYYSDYSASELSAMEGFQITSLTFYLSDIDWYPWADALFFIYLTEYDSLSNPTTRAYFAEIQYTSHLMTFYLSTPHVYHGGKLSVEISSNYYTENDFTLSTCFEGVYNEASYSFKPKTTVHYEQVTPTSPTTPIGPITEDEFPYMKYHTNQVMIQLQQLSL